MQWNLNKTEGKKSDEMHACVELAVDSLKSSLSSFADLFQCMMLIIHLVVS
jgi:hypothetical protein